MVGNNILHCILVRNDSGSYGFAEKYIYTSIFKVTTVVLIAAESFWFVGLVWRRGIQQWGCIMAIRDEA